MADDSKPCHMCGKPLRLADIDRGRALSILGKFYCVPCADRKVQRKTGGDAGPPKSRKALLLAILAAVVLGAVLFLLFR